MAKLKPKKLTVRQKRASEMSHKTTSHITNSQGIGLHWVLANLAATVRMFTRWLLQRWLNQSRYIRTIE